MQSLGRNYQLIGRAICLALALLRASSPSIAQPSRTAFPESKRNAVPFVFDLKQPLIGEVSLALTLGGKRYLGRPNGSLTIAFANGKDAKHYDPGTTLAPVRSIVRWDGAVVWLTDEPLNLCILREGESTPEVIDLTERGWLRGDSPLPSWDRWRLGIAGDSLAIWSSRGALKLDRSFSMLEAIDLPDNLEGEAALGLNKNGRLTLAAVETATSIDGVQKAVTLYAFSDTGWKPQYTRGLPDGVPSTSEIAFWDGSLLFFDSSQICALPLGSNSSPIGPFRRMGPVQRPATMDHLSVTEDSIWVANGDTLVRLGSPISEAEAYMPWNGGARKINAIGRDEAGLIIASSLGAKLLNPSSPEADGFGGFVKVGLGEGSGGPRTAMERKLAALCDEWQGTPYVYGGSSRKGTDCSGFVMSVFAGIGIAIPHGSATLRTMEKGQVVTDELRFGDVLIYPGHVALYLGDGITAETISGKGVSRGDIWRRRTVVVRRLLNLADTGVLASRKKTLPRTKPSPARRPSRSRE